MIPHIPMRKLCWFALSCSAAIFLSVYLLPENLLLSAGIFCVASSFLCLLFSGKEKKKLLLLFLGLAIGFLWTSCYGLLFRTPALSLLETDTVEYTFTVTDFPKETSRGAAFPAKILTGGAVQPKVQLYGDYDALVLCPGDTITATVNLSSSDLIRGESVDYYPSKGVYLLGYIQGETSLLHHPAHIPLPYLPQWIAKMLKDTITQLFPSDVAGFLTALITGDKSMLPTGLYAAFQRSGIAHAVTISGLHIGYLAGLFSLLLGKHNALTSGLSMLLIFLYVALTGNSPSAVRAAFMTGFLFLAPLVGREPDKPTTLSFILLILLLQCPYAASSVSLQLSFAAVAGIYLITGPLNTRWLGARPKQKSLWGRLIGKVYVFLCSTSSTTLGALLFTTPLVALHFGTLSLAGPLTNLLTLWIISFLFLGGLGTVLLGLFSFSLAAPLAWLLSWPVRWVILIARTISQQPFTSISLLSGYLTGWFLVAYAIVLLWFFTRKQSRPLIPAATLVITLCAALLTNAWPALSASLTVAILDVGQGASTLFYSKGHAILVDCGGNRSEDAGDIAADYLQSLGTSHLDALILTHYHTDHAGGVPELLARLDVSLLILPDVTPEEPLRHEILSLAEEYGCDVELLSSDSYVSFGEAALQIYAPLGSGTANEEGLSVLCTAGTYDVLVTGDMDSTVERRLVKYKPLPDIELLIVGHHGSKSSTSLELLTATTPENAVISVGYNSYGHPTPEVLSRLDSVGCDIYRTDLMGTVTFTIKGE